MTAAMEILFKYAQEHMIRSLLSQEHEYADAQLCATKQEEAFLAHLDDKAQERYDNLRDEQNFLSSLYGRALFRAGFRLAMELERS